MTTNRATKVLVINNFQSTATITLQHQYSDRSPETITWNNVEKGHHGDNPLEVHYQTGFGSGYDYWSVEVVIPDGQLSAGRWKNSSKECYLTQADESNVLMFSVSESGFKLNMNSSSCECDISND